MTSRQQPFVGDGDISAQISSVNLSAGHEFSKAPQPAIRLLEGLGAKGDAHCGATVKHRSRVRKDPTQPNLRQVHLLHSELFDEAARTGHPLRLGDARRSSSPGCATRATRSTVSPTACSSTWCARPRTAGWSGEQE